MSKTEELVLEQIRDILESQFSEEALADAELKLVMINNLLAGIQ